MNTKTVEQLREEYNAESPIPAIENITMYINWLEQKLLTPSPERGKELTDKCPTCGALCEIGGSGTDNGSTNYFIPKSTGVLRKEGKTAEDVLSSKFPQSSFSVDKLFYPDGNYYRIIEAMEEYAQSTSKPVEPKTSVGEEELNRIADEDITLKISKQTAPELYDVRRFYFISGLKTGLSMQQGRGEEIEFAEWINNNQFTRLNDQWTSTKIHYSGCVYSSKELYDLFTQSRGTEGG